MGENPQDWTTIGPDYDHDTHWKALFDRVGELVAERGVKHAVFLGAGASAAVGMPTTGGFLKEAFGKSPEELLGGDRGFQTEEDLVAWLGRAAYPDGPPSVADIEEVWTWLEALQKAITRDPDTDEELEKLATTHALVHIAGQLRRQGQQAHNDLLTRRKTSSEGIRHLRVLVEQTQSHLGSCLQRVYGHPGEQRVREVWEPFADLLGLSEGHQAGVFTTNYDLVTEQTVRALAGDYGPVVDGFRERRGLAAVWDPSTLLDWRPGSLPLLKLHGSVHWYRLDGELRRHGHNEGVGLLQDASLAVVPPIIGKPDTRNEWSPFLYDMLRAGTRHIETWIVIGFSFRDQTIREVFAQALEAGTIRKCVIVAPTKSEGIDVNEHLRGLVEEFRPADGRMTPGGLGEVHHMNARFDPDILDEVMDHLP